MGRVCIVTFYSNNLQGGDRMSVLCRLYQRIVHVQGYVIWHVSLVITKFDPVWFIYRITAGPSGWLWGRYVLSTIWALILIRVIHKIIQMLDSDLSWSFVTITVIVLGCVFAAIASLTVYSIKSSKKQILLAMEELKNARR